VDNLWLTAWKEADQVNFLKFLADGFVKPNGSTPP
jgi:hypothetical protein